jgi:eukaryotic-like serine/threonine-protein kinase
MSAGARQPSPLVFEALAEIATGPTARVDLCRIAGTGAAAGRLIAVKRLHAHVAEDPQFVTMFEDEAWMTAALRHPNVVEVVGWGHDAEGMYLAVELVEGVSLARLMKTVFETGEAFTERMVVHIGAELSGGLAAAHALRSTTGESLNLVHRDLTPGNVLVGFAGQTKITDFGLAKAKQRLSKTLTGLLKGHPQYMAPEQARAEALDGRADLFSLGVVLFELFTGVHPWSSGSELEVFEQVATQPHADLGELRPKIDRELVAVVHQLLEKDPERRPRSAAEVRSRLLHWLDIHGYAEGNEDALGRFVRRNAMRQMRWFERAVAGEFRGVSGRAGHASRAQAPQVAPARSRRDRGGTEAGSSRQETTSASPARRRQRRPSPEDATDVGPRPAGMFDPASVPSLVDSGAEWSEEVPTIVQPTRSPAAARPKPPYGVDDESDQRTTDVHARSGAQPRAAQGSLARRASTDEQEDPEELPTRPQRRPDLSAYGRGPAPPGPPTLQAASSGAASAEGESLRIEAQRVLAHAQLLRERADAAAKRAAHRAVLAQLGADAAQLASDALQLLASGSASQASGLLSEARRIEQSIARGESSLGRDAAGGPENAVETVSAAPQSAPSRPSYAALEPGSGLRASGGFPSAANFPSAYPAPQLDGRPSAHPSVRPPETERLASHVRGAMRALEGEVLGLPLWLALGLAFALALALVMFVALLLG